MRFIKNYQTGEHLWTKPMKLPRTVRGQLAFSDDLHRKMMIDFTDPDHDIYNSDYGYGRGANGISKIQRGFRSAWRRASVTRRRANVRHGGTCG